MNEMHERERAGRRAGPVLAALALVGAGLAGCASVSQETCREAGNVPARWEQLGRADGQNGLDPQKRWENYVSTCEKVGVTPQQPAYKAGWDSGILAYCTPANGYQRGRRDHASNAELCPGDTGLAFQAAYRQGHRLWQLEVDIGCREMRIRDLEKDLRDKNLSERKRSAAQRNLAEARQELAQFRSALQAAEGGRY